MHRIVREPAHALQVGITPVLPQVAQGIRPVAPHLLQGTAFFPAQVAHWRYAAPPQVEQGVLQLKNQKR